MKRSASNSNSTTVMKKKKIETNAVTCSEVTANGDSILTVMNYNIDGLGRDLLVRTKACINIIIEQNADIVTLQEVVPPTKDLLEHVLTIAGYENKSGSSRPAVSYFTMCFIKKKSNLKFLSCSRNPFRKSRSRMGRDVLTVCVEIGGTKGQVVTSHLESTKSQSSIRCQQLKEIFDDYLFSNEHPVIFCGDTNLSYNVEKKMPDEAVALSWEGLNRLDDAYKASTAPTKFSTTWSRRFGPPGSRKLYCRFDRFYSNKKNIQVIGFNDGGFNVVGKNEIQGVNGVVSGYDTPSDHFGVVVKYAIKSNTKKIPSTSLDNNNGNSNNNDNNNNSNVLLNIEELRAKRLAALTGNKNDNKNEGSGNNNVDQHTTLKKNTNVRNNDVKSDDVIDLTDD